MTNEIQPFYRGRFSVAPMLDWTTRHCRYFHRQFSRQALLYTEMITAPAIIHAKYDLLEYDPSENPVALQLGGSDPAQLAHCAKLVAERGYAEINLNVGCPSDRVQNGMFGEVQTTLAVFTLGFGAGQLFWGPMADSFGRKIIILIGLVGSAIAAYFLTQVQNIETFYLLRLVQGLCAAAPAVVLGALVRDLFERNLFAKLMSVIMIISMLAPLLAPIVGGYIAKYFHWHSIFYVLVAMGILCVVLISWKIPETLAPEKRLPLSFGKTLSNFAILLKHRPTLGYVLIGGLTFAGIFCFLTSGSIVYIGLYGVSQENFGYF
ncbi:Bcr/CflA family efflux MFS transporter, partial [Mannheimia haemolytica]|uniref:Bcr/CflA family efflux MFS transporter n=1 Tax=Mannheimia haemolytica TaxID=75985 RepID=UPI001FED3228